MKKCCECTAKMHSMLAPVWALVARVYLFLVFYKSGILKVQDIINGQADRVIFLFSNEYKLPCPAFFAYTTSFIELIAAVMILFGFMSRLAALILLMIALFIHLTYMQHVSHVLWIFLSSYIVIAGGGKYSIDYLWCYRCSSKKNAAPAKSSAKAKPKSKPKPKLKTKAKARKK